MSENTVQGDAKPQSTARELLRANLRWTVSLGVLAAVAGAVTGFIPPWPASVLLFLGLITTVSLIAAERRTLAVISAIVVLVSVVWLVRPVVEVRPANPGDRVRDEYFGILPAGEGFSDITYKNVVVARGNFTLNTWLTASLYHVKSGKVQELNGFVVGRTPNAIGAPFWVNMRITLALGNQDGPEERITQLGSVGQSRGGGCSTHAVNDVRPDATQALSTRLFPGAKRIVYVEGDSGFHVDPTMSLEEFSNENSGNYLVVQVSLEP